MCLHVRYNYIESMDLSAIKFCKIESIDLSSAPEVKYFKRTSVCA